MIIYNVKLAQHCLLNNLHVEYFIWTYLRSLNKNGYHKMDDLLDLGICKSMLRSKMHSNPFFRYQNGLIILSSRNKFKSESGRKRYKIPQEELKRFPVRLNTSGQKIIREWNSTTIKYFLICLIGCQYDDKKPYALELISQDTGCSVSTIQRALKSLFVHRYNKEQAEDSPRSYKYQGKEINLSPNYNQLLLNFELK